MDKAKEALWTKSFVLDTLINFLVFLIYYLLIVIIAVVAKDNLHATASQAGLAVGIYIIGTVVARLLAGRFISILGCRKMLYLGLLIYLISTAMYFYTPNLLMLDSVRFLNGFAYGITSTATSTIIAAIIPTSRRGEGINYYGLSTSLAAAVGPFLGILMLHSLGYDFIIAFCVVLIILCGIGSVIMKFNEPKLGIESEGHKGIRISDYIEPRMNSISLVSILVGFAYSGVIGFMAAYTKDLDLCCICCSYYYNKTIAWHCFRYERGKLRSLSLFCILSTWYFLIIHRSLHMACAFIGCVCWPWIWYIYVQRTSCYC